MVIAHPGRQHSPQSALGLQEGGLLHRYLTSVWYQPGRWPEPWLGALPEGLRGHLRAQLLKRSFPGLEGSRIETYPAWKALALAVRRLDPRTTALERQQRSAERRFGRWAARRLRRLEFDAFLGYESASLECFELCRARNLPAVLDQAAVHWRLQEKLIAADDRLAASRPASEAGFRARVAARKQRELELADLLLVPSSLARNALLEAGIEPRRIRQIPYGVDLSLFRGKGVYRAQGTLEVLFVGSLAWHKGIHHLLQACARLEGLDVALTLIGRPAGAEGMLQNRVGRVRHVPFLPPADLVERYQRADVFVLPSLLDSFGLVALEAMACGTPVVVSEHAGVKDLVRDGIDGFVVPSADPVLLAQRIRLLLEERSRLEVLGRQARQRAEAYPWELYRRRLRGVLNEAVAARNATGRPG